MHRLIENAKLEQRSLLEPEAKELLQEYGIAVPAFQLIKDEEKIKKLTESIGYPLVMKIVSPDIIHKSEAGGVKVGIKDELSALIVILKYLYTAFEYDWHILDICIELNNYSSRIEGFDISILLQSAE